MHDVSLIAVVSGGKRRAHASSWSAHVSRNPLHGITLETMLKQLVNKYGWDGLAKRIRINCFKKNPNFKSSLTFLRKTPWARSKVEELYKNSRFWVDL